MRYLILLILLSSCYNQRKATLQHAKAVAAYPEIGAAYCSRTYPPKDSTTPGTVVTRIDTLWGAGDITTDTIYLEGKPVQVTKVVTLPGKVIRETYYRTDTIYRVDNAAVDLCRIREGKAVNALQKEQARADKYQGKAKSRLWIIIGLAMAIGVWTYFKIRGK
jgi:hypothetical protein